MNVLSDIKDIKGPKLLHVHTVKGKGYEKAEKDQTVFHAPGVFDKETGQIKEDKCHGLAPKYQTVFGRSIIELAEKNPLIVGITPAMATGCSLNMMMTKMPERTFDVGIAEQHAVTFSAGLASSGMIPFCNIYSTFLQRAYDQIIHDVALQKLNVVFCLDRGGLVGEDGATHHGAYDLTYLRCIPNMTIAAPLNEEELRNLMFTAQLPCKGPFAIRYPKGRGVMPQWKTPFREMTVGKAIKISEGRDVAILSTGHPGNFVIEACLRMKESGLQPAHYHFPFVKPLDEDMLNEIFKQFKRIVTVEDGTVVGGFGSSILEFMSDHAYEAKLKRLGVPDKFIEQGKNEELHHECGYDAEGIAKAVITMMSALS